MIELLSVLYAAIKAFGVWLASTVNIENVTAGFFGGFARAALTAEGSFLSRLFSGATGGLFAAYLTPLAILWLGIDDPNMARAAAFSTGLFGIYVFNGVLKLVKSYTSDPAAMKEGIRSFLLRFLNKPNGKE